MYNTQKIKLSKIKDSLKLWATAMGRQYSKDVEMANKYKKIDISENKTNAN